MPAPAEIVVKIIVRGYNGQDRIERVEINKFWRKLSGPGGKSSKNAVSRESESPSKNRDKFVAKGAFVHSPITRWLSGRSAPDFIH